ncbi:hypothetical protein [Halobacteriovorax sp.]|uniref:hypothetical protein n=1 Tax=Halobacteriovorax sp. TaxID=2020862 RepID=UPI00356A9E16
MKKILITTFLIFSISPGVLAKSKCNPTKHLEISCTDVKNYKRSGFCLKIEKKDKLTESKKVKICQTVPRRLRNK